MPDLVTRLHHELIRGLLTAHACPSNAELASKLGVDEAAVENLLRRLSDLHGVVLHPHVCEPWILHPFSTTPTIHWIEAAGGGWWAPCIWCAFGVAALAGGPVRIHTRIAAEVEPVIIPVHDGVPEAAPPLWAHFAIPPSRAWQNVHQHCSMVLAFRSPEAIDEWSACHRLPRGQAVPLAQVAALARDWYGRHADPDWHKWSVEEAQEIFHRAGLTDPFWDPGSRRGAF